MAYVIGKLVSENVAWLNLQRFQLHHILLHPFVEVFRTQLLVTAGIYSIQNFEKILRIYSVNSVIRGVNFLPGCLSNVIQCTLHSYEMSKFWNRIPNPAKVGKHPKIPN